MGCRIDLRIFHDHLPAKTRPPARPEALLEHREDAEHAGAVRVTRPTHSSRLRAAALRDAATTRLGKIREPLGVLRSMRQGGSDLPGPVLKERLGGGNVEGTGEQEALPAVAGLVSEQRELVLLLDALSERLD